MAIRQVLLNGTGTSGDGTTWNDLSDATSAYIGGAGLASAISASSAGDIVYVKGTESVASAVTMGSVSLALVQNPIRVLGCKSTTTNNQGSIVTGDLIDGIRNGGAATHAYLDADVPTLTVTGGSADITINGGYYYGMSFVGDDNITIGNAANARVFLEECRCEVTGSGDTLFIPANTTAVVETRNSLMKATTAGGFFRATGSGVHIGTDMHVAGNLAIFGNNSTTWTTGHHEFRGCDLSNGGETTIINKISNNNGYIVFVNCLFPTSWTLTGGTAVGQYRIESYGSDDTTGLTTGGSEQQMNIETQHGTVVTETTKVRTGGADDGATGLYSLDLSTFANGTALGIAGLSVKCGAVWVEGDGTSKNVEIYFTSDSGNTRSTDWLDTHVWGTVLYPDEAGTSQYNYKSSVANLLAAGSAVTDDTGSTWGAGTQNDQKIVIPIAPDYEGYVIPEIHFASGSLAETIYACPLPEVA